MNELDLFEKTMTVKEVAEALSVSSDSIKNCIRRIMPNKMQHGKTTLLTEKEVACISAELKTNSHVIEKLTDETASRVTNTTTELEVLANARNALLALDNLYKQKEAEYKAIIAEKDTQLLEQQPMVDGYKMFLTSHGSFDMQKTSALLKDENGHSPYGRNNLIKRLKAECILQRNGIPYREYIDRGLFEVRTSVHNGIPFQSTLVYPKGIDYLAKRLGLIVDYEAA